MTWWQSLKLSLLAALLVAICTAQDSQPSAANLEDEDGPLLSKTNSLVTISKLVDEVHLNFTVTDHNGKFIKDLRAEDFDLLDNNQPPEHVARFQAHASAPLRAVLLFDISSSIKYRFDFELKAANQFLKHVIRPQVDEAAIVSFGSDVSEVQSMTGDVEKLTTAVARLKPGGETALHDAIVRASRDLRLRRPLADTREIIIIISDGADTASHSSADECQVAAISSGAVIVVVDASVPSEHNSPGQIFLRKIAESSGGFVLPARLDSQLKGAFHTIEEVLRSQYAFSYKPAFFQRNDTYRTIELAVRKRGLAVHVRRGYFAAYR